MKKIILSLFLTFTFLVGYSQQKTITTKQFKTTSITPHLGFTFGKTDLSDNKSEFNTLVFKPIYGLTISKQFSHFLSLEADYFNGSCSGKQPGYEFTTKFTQIDGKVRVNFTNGQILANYRNTQLYGYLGLGMINYSIDNGSTVSDKDWVHVIPVGVGFKKKISDMTSMSFDLGYNSVNTDNFEGKKVSYSNRDGYMTASVGLQFSLGSKPSLEWDKYTNYFGSNEEHSVDTIYVKRHDVDTLIIKFVSEETNSGQGSIQNKGGEIVNFDFNKWDIKNKYFETLDDLVLKLTNNTIKYLVIDGYTDEVGEADVNVKVSMMRSKAVKNYLISKGVNPNKIITNYHGPLDPVSTDNDKNRRVELQLIKGN